jgi:hypothetical protein
MRVPLCGDNLVRIAFLDESGRSRGEPFIVVAGPIVHGDRTYRQLVVHLRNIATQFIPEDDRNGFIFHAKDIYHCSGPYFKPRKTDWPPERRLPILQALSDIPRRFGLPITFGSVDKAASRPSIMRPLRPDVPEKQLAHFVDAMEHVIAFSRAEIGIDMQMFQFPRDEICMIIAEDTDRIKVIAKRAHAILRDPDTIAADPIFSRMSGLPLRKVEDTPHFAAKADSAPLQIADVCAFLIMRRLWRRPETQPFFEAIAPQLVWLPLIEDEVVFGAPMGSEQIAIGQRY